MATLEINGHRVEVDDSFLSMSPANQQKTIDEIAANLGGEQQPQPDPNWTPPAPPPGMVMNPATGQMEDLRSPANPHIPTGAGNAFGVGMGQGIGFGGLDEAVGGINAALGSGGTAGQRYQYGADVMREAERRAAQDHTGAYAAGMGTGIVTDMALPGAMMGTLGRDAPIMAKAAASGATGAGMGATSGFLGGEGGLANRAEGAQNGAMLGMGVGLAAPVVGRAIQKVADSYAAKKAISRIAKSAPTTEQLRARGNALYDAIDKSGVQVKPEAFSNARQKIIDNLRANTGFDELPGPGSLTPKSARVIEIMKQADSALGKDPTSALPFKALDQMRRQAGAAAGDVANKTESAAGSHIVGGLDDFVKNLSPNDVAEGNPEVLKRLLPQARSIWQKMSKSQMIDDAINSADTYLSGSASGIRNQFAKILRNPKMSRSFTEAERKVMEHVAKGTLPEQMFYLASGGLGNLGSIGLGALTAGPIGAGAAALGALGMRKGASALAHRNAEIARAVVANGTMNKLPVASDASRRVIEALMRRTGAAASQ